MTMLRSFSEAIVLRESEYNDRLIEKATLMGCRNMKVVWRISLAQNLLVRISEGIDIRHKGCGNLETLSIQTLNTLLWKATS